MCALRSIVYSVGAASTGERAVVEALSLRINLAAASAESA